MGQEQNSGREPFFYVEMDLDYCGNIYGVLPCTASEPSGSECYNTYVTCQDTDNFNRGVKTYRFSTDEVVKPLSLNAFPVIIKKPTITPARLEIENGIGQRGAISISLSDFIHNDEGIDPYKNNRLLPVQGTFFSRLRRRNPFYQDREFKIITGYILDGLIVDTTTRLYLINKFDGSNKNGVYTITAKDILKLVEDSSALFPEPLEVLTGGVISAGSTTVLLRTGDGLKMPATGKVKIDSEIISYTGVSTDTLTGCIRGNWNSTAATHAANTNVNLVRSYAGVNVVNIIYDLLVNYAGVNPSYIPFSDNPLLPDEWDNEKANWLASNNLTSLIAEPTKISELIKQLSIQNSLSLWWNEKEQKIKMSATSIALANQTPETFNDIKHILADSLDIKEDLEHRLSQIWIYFNSIDYTKSFDDIENYSNVKIYSNPLVELPELYGKENIRIIYANWLRDANSSIVSTIASRLIQKDLTQNYLISFSLDAKDAALWTGEHAILIHKDIQGINGAPEAQKIHVTQVKESEPGHEFLYKAKATIYDPSQRFFFIASDTAPDYISATDTEKLNNGYLSEGYNNFSDGGSYYSITG